MGPNTFYVSNITGSLTHLLPQIEDTFSRAVEVAVDKLSLEAVEVVFIDAPEEAIPEWGVGGTTWGPNVIIIALDPSLRIRDEHLMRTLLHEFHHAMRFRGPGCGGNLAQMLVSEGLAVLFEEEVLGSPPPCAFVSYSEEHAGSAEAALFDTAFSQSTWFFGAGEVPRFFGYTYGYQRCKEYADRVGRTASQLVDTPSREVLGLSQ